MDYIFVISLLVGFTIPVSILLYSCFKRKEKEEDKEEEYEKLHLGCKKLARSFSPETETILDTIFNSPEFKKSLESGNKDDIFNIFVNAAKSTYSPEEQKFIEEQMKMIRGMF